MPPSVDDLIRETAAFFRKHWVPAEMDKRPAPEWGKPILPSGRRDIITQQGGCYALVKETTVIYVGVGGSVVDGPYKEWGIVRRFWAHVLCKQPGHYTLAPKWAGEGVTAIYTIGFDAGQTYLAYALEVYLIEKINPSRNTQKRRKGG